ncbi:DegT/DnrJ/EryC1/StrS family aminotransferase [Aureliella helgolandensis]|uniref:Pyridoxal phosphate-dependent aminotransferase EpsN n=1 Tax=Aureliella helgolandensis TaxID=2527968 RepID=A0A518G811_9BACT|nr:DegT/DnrJ/EryC1/StrS family aminotransferase [Aureliella helgolandensis]QDV24725.1 Putative pyridoxal phosphate-dependent aminotransferase EpsN [Aureliella helgolandensis]
MSIAAKSVLPLPSDQDASGRSLGNEEIQLLQDAVNSGTLTSTKGQFVKTLERRFADRLGVKHAIACSHGSAAIHCAIAAINPEPGDEIVTTSITDMGALTPILYQGAIPVFADVDPATCNVTRQSIEKALSDRTKAVVVTHLFGNPCDMTQIMELCRGRGIPVIEDCAQAFDAQHAGNPAGLLGDIGCFSLQQGKHITTGEGGIVTTNDDALARRVFLFVNKAWGYGDANPDHYFLALNYRMTELQGAVAVAQLEKLTEIVTARIQLADRFTSLIAELPGITPPVIQPGDVHSYWKYCVQVDADLIPGGAMALGAALKPHGVFSAPRYIQKPAFECAVFQEQRTFGTSRWPFTLASASALDYSREKFVGSYSGLQRILVLPWNEKYTRQHVEYIADCLSKSIAQLRSSAS